MKKKIIFPLLFSAIGVGIVYLKNNSTENNINKLRAQHANFLKNHPLQKTGTLSKEERKLQGLPPNAFFEQKYLSEINPATGRTHKENVFAVQQELNDLRATQRVPGDADNAWIERGPDNVGGRTRALLFDPNDATNETVFAGGVSGGLWRNTKISDPNQKWERIGIPENLAVSCIAVDPNNSQIFYVGTGESYVNGDVNGNGVWKSTDGGNTWTNILGGVTGQSYLDFNSKLTINSPVGMAGDFLAVLTSNFGNKNLATPITTSLVLADDGTAPTENACEAITNDLTGKIAVVRRGACKFSDKAKNAQDKGALAVIVVNNVSGNPFNMAGSDATVTIPSFMISKEDGDAIITALTNGTTIDATIEKVKNAANATVVPGIQHVNDIVVRNNNGTSEIYVAAGESGAPGTTALGADSFGMYKSTNGTTFTKMTMPKTVDGNEYEPNDIELASDNSIYVSTTQSYAFKDGGGAIFKSTTDGNTFVLKHTVPEGNRTEIATSPSSTGLVYILAQTKNTTAPVKIYKTTDDFVTVTEQALPNDADYGIRANDFTRGQSFYDLLLRVDPANENTVYVGGIDLFKSTDGATSWTQISKWSNNNVLKDLDVSLVHADQHGLTFSPSGEMVFGNDGGVYYSNDNATTIEARNNNYNTLQFYTVGVAPTTAFGGKEYFIAGAQDNGTQLVVDANSGVSSSTRAAGGDGAASFFGNDGSDQYYITNYVYNNSIVLYNYKTDRKTYISAPSESSNGDFINQQDLDSNLDILYSNYSKGSNYIIRRYSGILGYVATRENMENALMDAAPSAFKVSPFTTTATKLFVGLKNGKVLRVDNANTGQGTWTDITGPQFVGSVSDVELGQSENDIFVTMHNYGVKNIWYSNDGGTTWMNKEGNLPDIPVKTILQNPLNTDEVIIGTDLGVWKTTNFNTTSPAWAQAYNGMHNVPVLDLDLRDDNTVFAATYGRGVFSGKFTAATASVEEEISSGNALNLYPTISNGNFTVEVSSLLGKTTIVIYNLNGQEVYVNKIDFTNTSKQSISTGLQAGVYIASITNEKQQKFTRKIVVK